MDVFAFYVPVCASLAVSKDRKGDGIGDLLETGAWTNMGDEKWCGILLTLLEFQSTQLTSALCQYSRFFLSGELVRCACSIITSLIVCIPRQRPKPPYLPLPLCSIDVRSQRVVYVERDHYISYSAGTSETTGTLSSLLIIYSLPLFLTPFFLWFCLLCVATPAPFLFS